MTNPIVPTPITELPPAPLVTDTPEQFDDKAFPFAAALDGMRDGMNSAASAAYQNAVAADERALAAQQARDEVLPAAQQVGEDAEKVATDRAAVEQYVLEGPVLSIGGFTGVVPMKTVNGLPIVGAGGNIDVGIVKHSQRTTNAEITKDQRGHLIDVSGTFAQTFSAAALLNDGWWCYLRNSGQGDIVLTPASGELIDELASYVMYPGECRLIQCDGAALRSVVLNSFYKVFTASGTFIKPPGYSMFEGLLWGGGGSGRKDSGLNDRPGGGGGGCAPFKIPYENVSSSQSVVIGAGGAGQTTDGVNGLAGGASSFAVITARGGAGSGGGGAAYYSTAGINAASDQLYQGGSPDTWNTYSLYGAPGGGAIAGSDAIQVPVGSIFGPSGITPSLTVGVSGNAPGGGGASTKTGASSGAGARGELRIWGVI